MVLTETTIRQTPFNAQGTPVAFRARMAIQYGGNIDEVVERLGPATMASTPRMAAGRRQKQRGAMYELGTNHTRLWRSSKNEWFGDTPGFYWGDNNAKDLAIRLETKPDARGTPEYVPYVPAFATWHGRICTASIAARSTEQFGFLAYRTAPLVSASTMDAKIVTADMALAPHVWAAIGKPNQREWRPDPGGYAKNDGMYPSGYYLFRGEPSDALRTAIRENEQARIADKPAEKEPAARQASYKAASGRGGSCQLPMPTPGLPPVQPPIIVRFGPTISPRRSTRGVPPTEAEAGAR